MVVPIVAYDNGSPQSRTPPLGWSSWVALGPGMPGPEAQTVTQGRVQGTLKALIKANYFFIVGIFWVHMGPARALEERESSKKHDYSK